MADAERDYRRHESRQRLALLGLSETTLRSAVARGELARDLCSPNHPASFPGTAAWAEANAGLGEALIPEGWRRCDRQNIPKCVSPDGQIALTAITGDEGTGNRLRTPGTKRPRGVAGIQAVETNSQFTFLDGLGYASEVADMPARQTWYLLFHRHGNRVRLELSLPTAVSDTGVVQHWAERIILDDIDLDEGFEGDGNGGGSDIDVPVRRRSE